MGTDPARRAALKTRLVQILIVINLLLGTRYVAWRTLHSLNFEAWPFAVALLLAEVYSWVDAWLFGLTMWRVRERGEPPRAPPGLTVDVFVTTYNEDIDLVRATACAARDITYPHQTFILDDGNRPEMRAAAASLGVGYLTRAAAWDGQNRHAKAGNLINAMYQTAGEFILILDADQVPRARILDRVLGYFEVPEVAFVQTPQWFWNTPPGDPFGTASPLFYGPIQAGKDGWNAAFFCGSNAVLRRDALMRVGVVWYVRDLEQRVRTALATADSVLARAVATLPVGVDPRVEDAIYEVRGVVRRATRDLRAGVGVQAITWAFQRKVEAIAKDLVHGDLAEMRRDIATLRRDTDDRVADPELSRSLSTREMSPLGAIQAVRELLAGVDVHRPDQAEPVLPMSTVSVTEDMATAIRLHALGYTSVYHHEVLAVGLAPDELHSALSQRLRWAQGTIQVLLLENPLWQHGLTLAQRLLYLGTMWSYLSGFAAVVYLMSPVLFLLFGVMPVRAYSWDFFGHLLPWLVANQLLFWLVGWGLNPWRGQQYSLALFPLWLQAFFTTVGNVYFGYRLGFVVTSKTHKGGAAWSLVAPQLGMMVLLGVAVGVGVLRLALGHSHDVLATLINVFWACYSLLMLSVVIEAARYHPRGRP